MKRRTFVTGSLTIAGSLAAGAYQVSGQTVSSTGKRVRRKLSNLAPDDPFFEKYAEAITLMHELDPDDPRSWQSQSRIHADFCNHEGAFLQWHRPYLDCFERICGSLIGDDTFALPYWDWEANNGRLPQNFYDNNPLNVTYWNDPSNYFGRVWGQIDTVPYRRTSPSEGLADDPRFSSVFTEERMNSILRSSTFRELALEIDGPHGTAHGITGGSPAAFPGSQFGHMSFGLSSIDPVFWLHHANVDRLWAASPISLSDQIEELRPVLAQQLGDFFDENGDAKTATVEETLDLDNFDYTYDFLDVETASPEMREIQFAARQFGKNVMEMGLSNRPEIRAVGQSDVNDTTNLGDITSIPVQTETISEALITPSIVRLPRTLGENQVGIGFGKVVARFNGVQPLRGSVGNFLKVFVNCPYLNLRTDSTDRHFAGMISFFGCPPDKCSARDFSVDLSQPLRDQIETGRLDPQLIDVQLVAFLEEGQEPGTPVAKIENVEIFVT